MTVIAKGPARLLAGWRGGGLDAAGRVQTGQVAPLFVQRRNIDPESDSHSTMLVTSRFSPPDFCQKTHLPHPMVPRRHCVTNLNRAAYPTVQ